MKENFKLLGRRIKFMRMERGISQTMLAELIGLSQTNLSNMESGRTSVTVYNLFKMREIFNCKMSDFFIDFDSIPKNLVGSDEKQSMELVDALHVLKLLRSVDIKGL